MADEDELYLENLDEFVNDENRIVSRFHQNIIYYCLAFLHVSECILRKKKIVLTTGEHARTGLGPYLRIMSSCFNILKNPLNQAKEN